ncbi:MAG: transposase [Candidatus Accumulibacter sp.]|nr:transposase [Accumulibacter sp.]
MKLIRERFDQIQEFFPRRRGSVRLDNLRVLNAVLSVCANGCKWRAVPEHLGHWHTGYTRMMRWRNRERSIAFLSNCSVYG